MLLIPQDIDTVETDLVFVFPSTPNKIIFIINQFMYIFHLNQIDVDKVGIGAILSERNEMGILKLPIKNWLALRKSIFNFVVETSTSKKQILPSE